MAPQSSAVGVGAAAASAPAAAALPVASASASASASDGARRRLERLAAHPLLRRCGGHPLRLLELAAAVTPETTDLRVLLL
mmetsp:Transcript_23508/g.60465  ORF Transcript_23508/g.60465 Transcript_23508/m.60465 type:complete len:81 (-) Transcript_23508:77-319(-)